MMSLLRPRMLKVGLCVLLAGASYVTARAASLAPQCSAGTLSCIPFFVSGTAEASRNSNIASLNLPSLDSTQEVNFTFDSGVAYRHVGKAKGTTTPLGFEVGFEFFHSAQSNGNTQFELDETEIAFRAESDIPLSKLKFAPKRLKRLTAGMRWSQWDSRLADRSFASQDTVAFALQAVWNETNLCTFDNVLLYYETGDFDEGNGVPALLSREGDRESWGAEVNLYIYGQMNQEGCRRPGIFRRYIPAGATSLSVGYREDDVETVANGEYAAKWRQLYVDLRRPLCVINDETPIWSLDLSLYASRAEFDNPSQFDQMVARSDSPRGIEAALVRHFGKVDFRIGYRGETNKTSDVDRYNYDQSVYFLGLQFELFKDRHKNSAGGSTGSGGSQSGKRGGQSGSSNPVNPAPPAGGG